MEARNASGDTRCFVVFETKLSNPNVPLMGSTGVAAEDLRSIRGEGII
jgi:hypothetical protein